MMIKVLMMVTMMMMMMRMIMVMQLTQGQVHKRDQRIWSLGTAAIYLRITMMMMMIDGSEDEDEDDIDEISESVNQ